MLTILRENKGLFSTGCVKRWMGPCHERWPNGLRRSWSRSEIRSQRLLFALPDFWLQAGIAQQGMGILDKDPTSIRLHSNPPGLCYWCELEEGWPHCLAWPLRSKPVLSTNHSSLKDACWIFCICIILIPKLSLPILRLPYRFLFKIVQPEHCNFSFERVWVCFFNDFILLHWGKL